jgi:hypothetical protein
MLMRKYSRHRIRNATDTMRMHPTLTKLREDVRSILDLPP